MVHARIKGKITIQNLAEYILILLLSYSTHFMELIIFSFVIKKDIRYHKAELTFLLTIISKIIIVRMITQGRITTR